MSIRSLFLTLLCRFAKGRAMVQTPRSNQRQKGVVVWKLRMDTLLASTGSSTTTTPPTHTGTVSYLPVLNGVAKVSAWDLR